MAGWLMARVADATAWPLNLLRDLPYRTGRLIGTLAARPNIGAPDQLGAWLHALVCCLFDWVGGPEITQFVWRLAAETRPLTADETRAAEAVFGSGALRYRDVRIAQGGFLRLIFSQNKNRAFATWHTINLPDGGHGKIPLLVHELTHVYQYERVGSIYIGQGLWAQARLGRKAYDYGGVTGLEAAWAARKRYRDYNREQQGQIAQDYCALARAGRDTTAYDPYIADLRNGFL